MKRLRYSGTEVFAPPEIVEANPGQSSVLSGGMERDVPDVMAKELLERDYWTEVKPTKAKAEDS